MQDECRCVKGGGRQKARSAVEERGERPLSYFRNAARERNLRGTFLQHADTLLPLSTSEKKNDISATRKAAGKRTKIAVRFLYYFSMVLDCQRTLRNGILRRSHHKDTTFSLLAPNISSSFFPSFFPPRPHPYCVRQQPYSIPRHPYSVSQHNKDIFHKRKGMGVIFLKLFLCHFQRRKATSPYICKKKGLLELSAENT